jgi:hypothetical protein
MTRPGIPGMLARAGLALALPAGLSLARDDSADAPQGPASPTGCRRCDRRTHAFTPGLPPGEAGPRISVDCSVGCSVWCPLPARPTVEEAPVNRNGGGL